MQKHTLISDLIETLAQHKRPIINHVMNSWRGCDFTLSEPKLVKSYVMDKNAGVDYLNKNLAKSINGAQNRFVLKFGGVYAHQRPYIARNSTNVSTHPGTNISERCELADLLCITVFVDNKKNVISSQASFFQAKKDDVLDNQTQRWFYDFDDQFDYAASSFWEKTAANTAGRSMPNWAEQRASAFQYLILNNGTATARLSPWNVNHKHLFGFFIYRLMTFSAGKSYDFNESASGGWSSVVNDVLRMGANKMSGKARNSPDLDELVDHFNDFLDHDVYFLEKNDPGVPIVIAIIQDTKQG
ncbi:hypothetical protein ACHAC9_00750 [Massilia sp. CMS3.1]|uniref:hypothetical protein n=1 Tax=Massilia sp. CMS3.1 TaxID=3373083 RepID=UPI003EE7B2AC